jgi:hypothetical protein
MLEFISVKTMGFPKNKAFEGFIISEHTAKTSSVSSRAEKTKPGGL